MAVPSRFPARAGYALALAALLLWPASGARAGSAAPPASQAAAMEAPGAPETAQAPTLAEWFRTAYSRDSAAIAARLANRLAGLCRKLTVPDTSAANRAVLLPLLFRHTLLSSPDAGPCSGGHGLGTVYLSHGMIPDPRRSLRRLPDSARLADLEPPKGSGREGSLADSERMPALYLADLASERPGYLHPDCGALHAFGSSSEREMASRALLAASGIRVKSKIKQLGAQVWSELLLDLAGPAGRPAAVVLTLDHTYDDVAGWPLKGTRAAWAKDLGEGPRVAGYNRRSLQPSELARVKAIRVGPAARLRLDAAVAAWLKTEPDRLPPPKDTAVRARAPGERP